MRSDRVKILVLSGSNVGNKTARATLEVHRQLAERYGTEHEVTYVNLRDKQMEFADGRHYLDYTGDTGEVVRAVMDSDVIIVGSPIFQASIPAALKNVFDLLPQNALEYKTVSMLITAGSNKHFLVAEHQLKPILGYLKANIVPNYVFLVDTDLDAEGIRNDDVHFRIRRLIEDTMVLAEAYKEAWEQQEESYGF